MTDEQIAQELAAHAERIKRAEREGFVVLPPPLDQKAFELGMQQLRDQADAWAARELSRIRNKGTCHAKAS